MYVKISLCFVTIPCDVLGQVWNLIVLIPDPSLLTYFQHLKKSFYIFLFLNALQCKFKLAIKKEKSTVIII